MSFKFIFTKYTDKSLVKRLSVKFQMSKLSFPFNLHSYSAGETHIGIIFDRKCHY